MKGLMKSFAIMLLFCLLSGCSHEKMKNNYEKTPSSLPHFIFHQNDIPPSISAIVTAGNNQYEMARGNYTWTTQNKTITTDAASPIQLAKTSTPILMEPGHTLEITIEQDPEIEVYLWNSTQNHLLLEDYHQITVPLDKGHYIYEAIAKWANGEVSYTFVVEVH
ncbi:hypothetical protein [Bacillus sp. 1P06AnD]|uniref:hypothetical protein n=1 Tax=Bacillus sp. 1P06AnD TaxID=3132208 RepID=UPI0039A26A35